ncbi:65-kDa microtubule-associated protein 2 [Glycine max]|nr:65-kDa microtubule-associated protein 2 [Glycine max]
MVLFLYRTGGSFLELLAKIEEQIIKAKDEVLSRKEVLDRIDKWVAACEEENWLDKYNQDNKQILILGNALTLILNVYAVSMPCNRKIRETTKGKFTCLYTFGNYLLFVHKLTCLYTFGACDSLIN